MKRIFVTVLTAAMLLSLLCSAVSADISYDAGETVYSIPEASEVSFSYAGVTGVTLVPQSGTVIEDLIDGDAVTHADEFGTKGVVLVRNDHIKSTYEAQKAQVQQSLDAIPTFSFTIKYDSKVTFDALYVAFLHEINHTIATPGNNQVVLEISDNGDDWKTVDTYFYRPDLPDYTGEHHDATVEEHVIPLGKDIAATYVRMTFDFMVVPETVPAHFWTYYTNVYEWCGFTELGVAEYRSGEKPVVMTQEEANTPDVEIDGEWILKGEASATYYKFENSAVQKVVYELNDYETNGLDAEVISEANGTYDIYADEVTILIEEQETVYTVTFDENGNLVLNDGLFDMILEKYSAPESDPESSEVISDSDSSDNDDQDTQGDEDEDEDEDDKDDKNSPNGNSASDPSASGTSTTSVVLPIIIAVGVIAVIAVVVVVVIIILKKKKQ